MQEVGYFYLYSLGCPKNLVDSEWLSSQLMEAGWRPTDALKKADVIIINTCSFIEKAVRESIDSILELHRAAPDTRLVVTGCLPLRYGKKLRDLLPEVSTFLLSRQMEMLDYKSIEMVLSGTKWVVHKPCPSSETTRLRRIISTPFYSAYVKIADGCNRRCAFCTLPAIRGRYRSRPPNDIVREVKYLVDQGVKEIVLVAQDTVGYGMDLAERATLATLLEQLVSLEGITWIKLLYLYPDIRRIDRALIDTIKRHKTICPILDVPIQHASDRVLRLMRRPGIDAIRRILCRLREIPGIRFRTTVMVGFPGETREDFESLCAFIEEGWFYSLGVFPYSDEEGTRACNLPDKVPEDEKKRRVETLMEIQQRVSFRKHREMIGDILPVLVEGLHEETDLLLRGRTAFQFPEIDGCVMINKGTAEVGQVVPVRITDSGPYDLVGEVVNSRSE